MTEFIIKVSEDKKAKLLLNFLKQIDFIEIGEATELSHHETAIRKSIADLKHGKTASWKNKTVRIKHA